MGVKLRDAVERIVVTYVISLLAALSLGGAYNLSTLQALALAGAPAALAALKALILHSASTWPVPRNPWADLGERAAATFLENFIGALAMAPTLGLSEAKGAALAAVASAMGMVKGGLASAISGTVSPASFAPGTVIPTVDPNAPAKSGATAVTNVYNSTDVYAGRAPADHGDPFQYGDPDQYGDATVATAAPAAAGDPADSSPGA